MFHAADPGSEVGIVMRIQDADRRWLRIRAVRRFCAAWAVLVGTILVAAAVAAAREPLDVLAEDPLDDPEIAAILGDGATTDLAGLRDSHLSIVKTWRFMKPARAPKQGEGGDFHWRADGDAAAPLGDGPIATRIRVPTSGEYRICLRQHVSLRGARPVTMSLQPLRAEGPEGSPPFAPAGRRLEHAFGGVLLAASTPAGQQEKQAPVRFESEMDRMAMPREGGAFWEHWDVPLEAGVYEMALATRNPDVRVSAVFLSRSRDFRPSLASNPADATLGRIHVRYRLLEPAPAPTKFSLTAGLTYHWRGRRLKGGDDIWGWDAGGAANVPGSEWTPFIDVTEAAVPGPGPWSTWRVRVPGVRRGRLAVQFAWTPREEGVVTEFETGLGPDGALFRFPNGAGAVDAATDAGAWGMHAPGYLAGVLPQEAIISRYFEWAAESAKQLAIAAGHPLPRLLRLSTSCGVNVNDRGRAVEMLASLGVNWIDGAPRDVVEKLGLRDAGMLFNVGERLGGAGPAGAKKLAAQLPPGAAERVERIKIGDEIATFTDPSAINADPALLDRFHRYLRERMDEEGSDPESFLGVANLSEIRCMAAPSAEAGRFERRLAYHSHRFCHLVTADHYRGLTDGLEAAFPNAKVCNNYSPHPVFLTGSDMNHVDWFVLCRNRAQSLGWGEDWAYLGSWGLGTDYQCVSFYGALVECSVRRHGQPAGFYVGVNCGGAAQKIFSCIARGLHWLELYAWGPIDALAEGSNAWSEMRDQYTSVMKATHALGPADRIVAEGSREPRRVAILYNRSHEICQNGHGRLNHDWMWTWIALASAHVPADVIIEEDLVPEELSRYKVVFLGGFNLERRHVVALRDWVAAGGLLIGTGGAARFDVSGDPLVATEELFGAVQRPAGRRDGPSRARAVFSASAVHPEPIEVATAGILHVLEPSGGGTAVARYDGGECAAVTNVVGAGRTLLLGFHPGYSYRAAGAGGRPAVLPLLAAPVRGMLGRPRADVDDPRIESMLFEHESGIAVTLANFTREPPVAGRVLSVAAGREVREVVSGLRGPLPWRRDGDRVEVTLPAVDPVDVIILR